MKVKLISFSQPPELAKINCIEDLVAYCARVSNPANQSKEGRKLLQYLMKESHWSPFEMVNICLEITTTRDIARQILRHRSFSFQEFSQRYADPTNTLGYEVGQTRLQDEKNRQNSIDNQDLSLDADWKYMQQQIIDAADHAYLWARSKNIAKEQARKVLPEGLTLSRMYMNGTLRSWIHYIEQRRGNGTQREHQEIALACKDVIAIPFPLIKDIV